MKKAELLLKKIYDKKIDRFMEDINSYCKKTNTSEIALLRTTVSSLFKMDETPFQVKQWLMKRVTKPCDGCGDETSIYELFESDGKELCKNCIQP